MSEDWVNGLRAINDRYVIMGEGNGPLEIFDTKTMKICFKKKFSDFKYVRNVIRSGVLNENLCDEIAVCTEGKGLWFVSICIQQDGKVDLA